MHEFIRNKYTKDFLDIYKLNKIPASRSDLARLMLLFEYGGFYIDAAMEFKRPLKELINFNTEILLVRRDDVKRYENKPEMAHVINGIIASKPQSQYIEACIELAFSHLKSGIYNNNVWRATGPFVLNEILKQISNETIHIASFTDLLKNYIHYKRPKEVSNLWVKQQENGIMDLSYFRSQV
jgi:mannosyltransferase OCH1-like enzyme